MWLKSYLVKVSTKTAEAEKDLQNEDAPNILASAVERLKTKITPFFE